ncbi:hypothetical protein [Nocardioides sp. 1609]|uniref:hypothetical protein n=1 Tax=Nocardioides sp. 1609 TaxID=2508327 RepID=UPI0010700BCC|nr:hypothetical protein [Nocardioides sp. 1609]
MARLGQPYQSEEGMARVHVGATIAEELANLKVLTRAVANMTAVAEGLAEIEGGAELWRAQSSDRDQRRLARAARQAARDARAAARKAADAASGPVELKYLAAGEDPAESLDLDSESEDEDDLTEADLDDMEADRDDWEARQDDEALFGNTQLGRTGDLLKLQATVVGSVALIEKGALAALIAGAPPHEALQVLVARQVREQQRMTRQEFAVTPEGDLDTSQGDLLNRTVGYDRGKAQDDTHVAFKNGKLVHGPKAQKQGAVDTAGGVTHFSGPGWQIFAVSSHNQLHVADHKIGKYHHSSLLAGEDVAMAGEIRVENGVIKEMSAKSGHYRPKRENCVQFLHWLEKDGIPLDFAFGGHGEKTVLASDYVRGMDTTGVTKPALGYQGAKTAWIVAAFRAEHGEGALQTKLDKHEWKLRDGDVVDASGALVDPKLVRTVLKAKLTKKPAPEVSTFFG